MSEHKRRNRWVLFTTNYGALRQLDCGMITKESLNQYRLDRDTTATCTTVIDKRHNFPILCSKEVAQKAREEDKILRKASFDAISRLKEEHSEMVFSILDKVEGQ